MAITKLYGHSYDAKPAGADLTGKEGYAVKLDTDGTLILATAGDPVWGIVIEGTTAGKYTTCAISDMPEAVCGAAIAEGAKVASDANGKLVTATTGDDVIGVARGTTAAADEFLTILIDRATNAA